MSYIKCTNCGQNNNIDRTNCICCRNDLARVDNPLTSMQIKRIKRIRKFMSSNMICMVILIIFLFTSLFPLSMPLLLYVSLSTIFCSHKVANIVKDREHESFYGVCILIRNFWFSHLVFELFLLLPLIILWSMMVIFGASKLPVANSNYDKFLTVPIVITWLFYTLVYSLWRWFEIYQLLNLMCQDTDHKNTHPSLWCNRFAILCALSLLIILETIIICVLPSGGWYIRLS